MSPRIIAIVAAHNEADIIGQTIQDLVVQGIEVYVLDNGSSDETGNIARSFVGRGVLRVEPFPEAGSDRFELAAIIARKEQLARELEADWFINHDADEFRESPWTHLNLRQGIELVDRMGFNAIDFHVLNFWPTHDLAAGGDVRESFRHFEPGGEWDRVQVRCWKKTEASLDLVSTGGHEARFEGRRIFPIPFLLRHYPIRSQAHGTRKVFEERLTRFSQHERSRGWHVQYDSLDRDHRFTRDPSTLRLFDPDVVRAELQIHHRRVDELASELRDLSREVEQRSREAADHQAISHGLRDVVQAHLADKRALEATVRSQRTTAALARRRIEELLQQLDEQAQYLAQQGEALRRRESESERQHQEHVVVERTLQEQVGELQSELERIATSRSWRLTAPFRTTARLLRRR